MSAERAPTISAVIIARDEAHNLPDCLAGLGWCDEIVVLDGGSRDDTVALARAAGAHVQVAADWPGFGAQKNRALALARSDWVLSIDADERVSPELAAEIRAAIASPGDRAGFAMPRLSSFCGQFMRHGGWYPDRVLRVFRRGAGRFSDDVVHETVLCDGPTGLLRHDLLHISYRDLDDVLDKMRRYSRAGADKAAARGRSTGLLGAWAHSRWAFVRAYVLRRGFLDGRLGFVLACAIADETWYRYARLWQLTRAGTRR